jgi:alkylhydroperoxidase/carboxymuconolactone decarboxylase family protein YurZ
LLGAKIRELISLAVAVTLRLRWLHHRSYRSSDQKLRDKDEIAEALGVATTVNAGAALVYFARAMDALKEYPRAAP